MGKQEGNEESCGLRAKRVAEKEKERERKRRVPALALGISYIG